MYKTNYRQLLRSSLHEFAKLSKQRDTIDARLFKLRQLIYATLNLLPDDERAVYQAEIAELAVQMGSLTDSVREILKVATQRNVYLTAAEVRDRLLNAGFDFSRYTSNPLVSVNTILRRMKRSEVEITKRDGVSAYRWKPQRAAE